MREKGKYLFFTISISVVCFFSGCADDEADIQLSLDEQNIELATFLNKYNIHQQPTASGLYFIPVDTTNSTKIEKSDYVLVTFVAQLLDGEVFSTSQKSVALINDIYTPDLIYDPFKWKVSNQIDGIVEGLKLMSGGDSAWLIIPPDLGFGEVGLETVPPYSHLVYYIKVEKVIKDPQKNEQEMISNYLGLSYDAYQQLNSGVYLINDRLGDGKMLSEGDIMHLNYSSYLIDGRVIESNEGKETINLSYSKNLLIEGLYDGLGKMRAGSKTKIIVPYNLAHGASGRNEPGLKIIPPYSTILFEVTLHEVIPVQ